jgi:hypothetical protein
LQFLLYFVRAHRTIIGQSPVIGLAGGSACPTLPAPRYWETMVTVWVRPPAAI